MFLSWITRDQWKVPRCDCTLSKVARAVVLFKPLPILRGRALRLLGTRLHRLMVTLSDVCRP
eukprot:9476706-Pyramimonas_sp.AAC.1